MKLRNSSKKHLITNIKGNKMGFTERKNVTRILPCEYNWAWDNPIKIIFDDLNSLKAEISRLKEVLVSPQQIFNRSNVLQWVTSSNGDIYSKSTVGPLKIFVGTKSIVLRLFKGAWNEVYRISFWENEKDIKDKNNNTKEEYLGAVANAMKEVKRMADAMFYDMNEIPLSE